MDTTSFPVIGMSPGNSYFKDAEVRHLLKEVVQRFGKTAILVADTPAISTYIALGYPESRARNKAIPKGNNLKNRTRRIANELGFNQERVRIIDWDTEVAKEKSYLKAYQGMEQLYQTNKKFRKAIDETTQAVLIGSDKNIYDLALATKTATHYLLSELSFLEFAPGFLNTDKVIYVYHKNWPVYEEFIAGKYDHVPRPKLDFLLLENPYETFRPITSSVTINKGKPFQSSYNRILTTKVIRASYEDYPPSFMSKGQKYTGIFYEVLERFAATNGFKTQYTEETGYGVIVDGLTQQRFDIFAATVWPTPARLQAASFTIPLYYSNVHMWVRKESAHFDYPQIRGNSRFSIAVKENDISHAIAQEEFPNRRLVYVPQLSDPIELLNWVIDGKAEATFAEEYLVKQLPNQLRSQLIELETNNPIRQYGNSFMVGKGEYEFKKVLDKTIRSYLESGWITKLIKKYTGSADTFPAPNI